MRLFVASVLPAAERASYDALVQKIATASASRVRPIPRDSAHITHAFLGEVREIEPASLAGDLTQAARDYTAFDITLGPPQLLRAARVPRLVFAPIVRGADTMAALSRAIVLTLRARPSFAELPFPKAPHITLARFRRDASMADARRVEELLTRPEFHITATARIDRVQLMKSVLGGSSPVYEALASVSLRF